METKFSSFLIMNEELSEKKVKNNSFVIPENVFPKGEATCFVNDMNPEEFKKAGEKFEARLKSLYTNF